MFKADEEKENSYIVKLNEIILVTGATGFIGSKVVEKLILEGFSNLRIFIRSSDSLSKLKYLYNYVDKNKIEIIEGNLLSLEDCKKATDGVSVIIHLAAGSEKSFAGCFMNSALSTKNLLESVIDNKSLKRFLNVSSFAVYSNMKLKRGELLDENCEIDDQPMARYEAYSFGKVKQEEIVIEYGKKHNIPFVIVRPGVVYGPGSKQLISARVGIDSFGIFLHLGGFNKIPLTYVDNCAEAIILAGLKKGIEGEVFNIVDDDLPTSKEFLKKYKKNVKYFKSIYIPYRLFYLFCYFWEKYSDWSEGQIPPVFNRRRCSAYWRGNQYSNEKIKRLLGWAPKVSLAEGLRKHFEYCRGVENRDA